jgi:outer membrane protein OmpA-like peptidoglycan-associated protein/tetratricopeptide (TPR) repeat protein
MKKNLQKYWIIIILLFINTHLGTAQITKLLKKGDEAMSELNWYGAIEAYQEAIKLDPEDKEANFKLGFAYQHSIHKERSLPFILKVYRKDPIYTGNLEEVMSSHPQFVNTLDYFLAVGYHHNNMFREAIKHYEKAKRYFEAIKKDNIKNQELSDLLSTKIKETEKRIIECKYGEKFINEPVNAQIENVGKIINGKYADYAPVISADESMLVFTSRREGTTGGKRDKDGDFFEDIYISRKNNLGEWTEPKNIGPPINTKFHDATIAIAPDGKELFIYRDNSKGTGDIYYSILKADNKWTEPKSMGKNINSEENEASISMSSDKKTVYFSSNRPGGYGGLDIYKSQWDETKKEWGPAVNLGPTINTEYDDDAPFISFDGKHLYFASEGHSSMGGFDTFRSTFDGKKWTTPENLGYPINTADNDIYFVLTADEKTAYYASAKEGGYGEKDIYQIRMPKRELSLLSREDKISVVNKVTFTTPKIENAPNKPKLLLKGIVRDIETKELLEAKLELILFETNDNLQYFTSDKEGKFSTTKIFWDNQYILAVEKDGYLFHSESFAIPPETNESKEIELLIELVPLKKGAKINLTIFFDFDKANIRKESNSELKRLLTFMKKYPQVKIEIAGHTDNIGTDQRNKILSQQRAKAVVNYLQDNGIDEMRMIYQGYGASKPVAPNKKPNGNDDPEGRQKNRRTECVVTAVK